MPVRHVLLALLAALAPAAALADEAPEAGAGEELRDVAITFAPGNLLFLKTLKLNGELRLADEWGLQLSLGGGKLNEVSIGEAGGQLRWYAVGDFDHGMQLGLEVLFLDVSTDVEELNDQGIPVDVEGGARATAIGPFLGYKVAFDGGFTLETQLGLQHYGVEAYADADLSRLDDRLDGMSALLVHEVSLWLPLANLNLGWSF